MHNRRVLHAGQSTLEYAVLIAVVAAAAIGMQIYVKRGIQGRLRQSADQVGEQFTPIGYTAKYETTTKSTRKETLNKDGTSKSEIAEREEENDRKLIGTENVPQLDKKLFGD